MPAHSRRTFLHRLAHSLAAIATGSVFVPVAAARAWSAGTSSRLRVTDHPKPREGITAARVLSKEQLVVSAHLIALFDGIRAIPGVADGIRCHCGCAELPGFYSLLSCFEGEGMARSCPICQGEGRVTVRLHKEGKSLDEIRAAIDAQWG
ncbi:MAG: hypothetical protein ABIW79_05425 [Gemmatimonas sp.]